MTDLDVIVYGATGFTGGLVCEHLARTYGPELRWAMAGRDGDKLTATRASSGAPARVRNLIVDLADAPAVAAMVAAARIVISTAGPFATMGEPLVEACARHGTDYVDLTGDAAWIRRMIDAYEEDARSTGARLIFSAGFDSVPSDLGVHYLQHLARERFGAPAVRVEGRVRRIEGILSGGTVASARASAAIAAEDPRIPALLADPFALMPDATGPGPSAATELTFDPVVGNWVAPFIMAGINVKTVHRSNALQGRSYGDGFTYDERLMLPGATDEATARAAAAASDWSDRAAVARSTLLPGEGPDVAARAAGGYEFVFTGWTAERQRLRVAVVGVGDPGYRSTSRIIAETALCLLQDGADVAGGMWTPASALGDALRRRLTAHAGLSFAEEA